MILMVLSGVGVAALGAILGSFLNALLFRYHTGRSVIRGRSRCMRCGHTLSVIDLVPVFSYVFLRGRCRYCRARISVQYPLVEIVAAVLSVSVWLQHPELSLYVWWLCVWLIVLFIVVYDLRHMIIPTEAALLLALLAAGYAYLSGSVLVMMAGPLLALPLFLLSAVSGGRWMGWSDSLFELSLGWLLGLTLGLTGLIFAFWIGAAVGLLLMCVSAWQARKKRFTMGSEIPLAPFLALGAAVVYFSHVDLFAALPLLF